MAAEERITFHSLSVLSNRFANLLIPKGVKPGDRVAVMLEPSLAFYVSIFGALKSCRCPYRKCAPWKGAITQWETDPPGNFRSSR